MQIDDELVQKLATLSRLSFDADAQSQIKEELQRMLDFVDVLRKVDTADVAPLMHMTQGDIPLRADEPSPTLDTQALMEQAPEANGNFFSVPRVVDKGKSS